MGHKKRLNVSFLTDRGLKREKNEDAILVNQESATFIVADGMGGHEKGEVASNILIEAFDPLSNMDGINEEITISDIESRLNSYIAVATKKMTEFAQKSHIDGIIGTTMVGLKYLPQLNDSWVLFYLGDSRAYHYSDEILKQISIDHSRYEYHQQVSTDSDSKYVTTRKNVVTKAIGNFDPYMLDIKYIKTKKDDILFLCSDGVSDLCTNNELQTLMQKYKGDLDVLSAKIKELVYMRGARDNLSFIIIEIMDE